MALYDLLNSEEGRFNMGLLAAAAPRATRTGMGERFQDVISGVDEYKRGKQRSDLTELEIQKFKAERAAQERALAQQAQVREAMIAAGLPGMPGMAPPQNVLRPPGMGNADMGAPAPAMRTPMISPENVPQAGMGPAGGQPVAQQPTPNQLSNVNFQTLYMRQAQELMKRGLPEQAAAAMESARKLNPEYSTTPQMMMVGGRLQYVLIGKDGSYKTMDGAEVKPDIKLEDLGGKKVAVDFNNLKPGQSFGKTMSPSESDSSKRGWAQIGISRAAENRAAAGTWSPPNEAGQSVNSRTGVVNQNDLMARPKVTAEGQLLYPPSAENPAGRVVDIPGFKKQPPAAFTDASRKLNDLVGALDDYKVALKDNKGLAWGTGAVPFSQGSTTTDLKAKYTTMMMGLKDLYTLGALAGPDMAVLEGNLTNPESFSGWLKSKGSYDKQLETVDRMMKRARVNLERSYGHKVPDAAKVDGPAKPYADPAEEAAYQAWKAKQK